MQGALIVKRGAGGTISFKDEDDNTYGLIEGSNAGYLYVSGNAYVDYASSIRMRDDRQINFGTGLDSFIKYDEDSSDRLIISGSNVGSAGYGGISLSGSDIYLDPLTVLSGTTAGPGSYLLWQQAVILF